MKILIVEDSERLQRSLRLGLERSGFVVDAAVDGEHGLALAREGTYDVIVLDVLLPMLDGLSVLRRLRADNNPVHVLILSARDQTEHRIEGLRLGADDYLTKPFAFEELVARLRALVRRKFGVKNPVYRSGSLSLDPGAREVLVDGRGLALTRNEFVVLEYLLAHRGRVVAKLDLLDHLHGGGEPGTDNAIEVIIHHVRRKIADRMDDEVIRTRRGHGYIVL